MNKNIGSNFDDFLEEENLFNDAEGEAIKRVLIYQSQQKEQESRKAHPVKRTDKKQTHAHCLL